MELLLPFPVSSTSHKISYADKILFIGSCFTEAIGNKMHDLKFDVLQNPNGILFDPLSICTAFNFYVDNNNFNEDDLFLHNELWQSWQHHSIFSGLDKQVVLQNINEARAHAHLFLKDAAWLVITLGTGYSYQLKTSGSAAANCHKVPANNFNKKLLSTDEIIYNLSATINNLRVFNSSLKIIFTVSPVRHVKDGLVENNRSKARLIEATHEVTEKFQNVFYFPAYELIIDVLRDYRFYKSDLVHPTEDATRFVFEHFCETFLDDPSIELYKEIYKIVAAMNHKPFQKESLSHKKFLQSRLEEVNKFSGRFPSLDFNKEKKYFSAQ
jgi:GSCFA family